ncbi:hypothetical protein Bra3105_18435 (plasmid) [Brachybacterium halotolerans subsp. kimchii]|uniref:hypothetical protein n=1 Tax=Brachybacterium halotolerans TaxID=2795215 RepID=UPI001E5F2F07|nr:hypothetical protein [Brachybacterium halotolerans]UEJ84610.1 hypothetical protein Bra3105_18435 [Brachybacterium halotolerans subsp. kimchii]
MDVTTVVLAAQEATTHVSAHLPVLADASGHAAALPVEIPDPGDPQAPPGVGGKIETLLSWLKWGGLALCIAGIIIAGALMAVANRRGEGGENVARLGWAMGGVAVISAVLSLVTFIAS